MRPEDILLGGMPTVCLRQVEDPAVWFKGFEQTYLERDVHEMSQVGNLMALRALLRLTALRTGQLLSPSQLRLENIMESSDGIGWGYHDGLCDHFDKAFPEE